MTNHRHELDMMILRGGWSVADSEKVQRSIAFRKYILRRKFCHTMAIGLARAAKWFEKREAAYASIIGANGQPAAQ